MKPFSKNKTVKKQNSTKPESIEIDRPVLAKERTAEAFLRRKDSGRRQFHSEVTRT
jgi:hypothetical protein